jgi:hypothetical protein
MSNPPWIFTFDNTVGVRIDNVPPAGYTSVKVPFAPTDPGAGNDVGVDDGAPTGGVVVGDVVGAGAAVVVVTGGFVVVVVAGGFVVVVTGALVVGVGAFVVTVVDGTVVVLTVRGLRQFVRPRLSCADAGRHPAMMTAPVTRPAIRIA